MEKKGASYSYMLTYRAVVVKHVDTVVAVLAVPGARRAPYAANIAKVGSQSGGVLLDE